MDLQVIDRFVGRHRFMSNFGPGDVVVYSKLERRWVTYRSGEHAFNAAKSLILEERLWVASAPTCEEAKRRGREDVTLRPGWDEHVRFPTMLAVQLGKFRPGLEIAKWLLDTGAATLIEGNDWHDNDWGDCRCKRQRKCAKPGKNMLGEILMRVRVERGGLWPTTPHQPS